MAKKNIKEVRDTIGINDKPISFNAMESITIMELGEKYKTQAKGTEVTTKDIVSTELSQNMIIPVSRNNIKEVQERAE